jgi:hypothetical protein
MGELAVQKFLGSGAREGSSRAVRQVSGARSPRVRSRVTNGRMLFLEGNGRTPWTRRWRDLFEAHSADLGGADCLSEAQRSLIRRCTTIEVQLEQIEGQFVEGQTIRIECICNRGGASAADP